ncbi:MAG TPA: ABC transporter substrate-binding protein [Candidatus Tectomicrobia bacterium]|nr:ABC transporter substrate-binding protein [Candidatus Tectomicrobia bacterium]
MSKTKLATLVILILANVVLDAFPATITAAAASSWTAPDWVSQGKYGGILTLVANADPDHWDLHHACCNVGPGAARELFNTLVMYNPVKPNEIIGDLAQRWEVSPDGMSCTFYLHQAEWWDGQPVTAADVKFSLDRMLKPDQPRPRVGALQHYIQRTAVIDVGTVRVHTKFPTPAAFLPFLAVDYAVIYPKHVLEQGVDFDDPKNIVGSGPFKLKSYQHGQSWELVKNPDYFKKGLPFLDGIQTFVMNDHHRVIEAFQTEQVLMCNRNGSCGLTVKDHLDLEAAMQGKGIFYWQEPTLATGINLNFTKPPFTDPRVRRAVYLAIDRREVIKALSLGRGTVGTPFYPNSWMSSPMEAVLEWPGFRQPKEADIAEAKQLLAEAGHPNGFKTSFLASPPTAVLALMIRQHLRQIGIEVEVRIVNANTLLAAQAQGDYAMTGIRHGPSILDPDELFLSMYMPGGPRNQLHWEDPRLTAIFEQQAHEPDPARRRALVLQAEAIIRQGETAWVTLYWGADTGNMVNTKVKNYHRPLTVHTAMTHEHLWLGAR